MEDDKTVACTLSQSPKKEVINCELHKFLVYCSCFYIGASRFSFSAYLFCCFCV
ncbi:unnamed protein product [Brassica oleracea]